MSDDSNANFNANVDNVEAQNEIDDNVDNNNDDNGDIDNIEAPNDNDIAYIIIVKSHTFCDDTPAWKKTYGVSLFKAR